MPHLSASQYDTYSSCPAQWAAEKIEGVQRTDPSEHLILGSAFHNTIEHDGKRRIMRSNTYTRDELLAFFKRALQDELATADPSGKLASLRETLEARGVAMIKAYAKTIAPKYWPISVEQDFDFLIPGVPPDANGEPWTFMGRIDGRTRTPDGRIVILDWKTASKPWPLGDEHKKGQATGYILSDLMMGRTPCAQQVTFVTFPTKWNDDEGRYDCTVDLRVTKRTLNEVMDYLESLQRIAREINRIRRGDAQPAPRPHWRCQFCINLRNCESGIQWMMDRNRVLPFEVPGYTPEKPKKRRKRTDIDQDTADLFGESMYEDVDDEEGELSA
ncbi:MAG: RecB family exonuclease [Ktedonobacterales bacterium]